MSDVYVLGAGFSNDAGMPIVKELVSKIKEEAEENGAIKQINIWLKEIFISEPAIEFNNSYIGNLEALLTTIENLARLEFIPNNLHEKIVALRHTIYHYYGGCFKRSIKQDAIGSYKEFTNKIPKGSTVITLNNDMVIEESLGIEEDIDSMAELYGFVIDKEAFPGKKVKREALGTPSRVRLLKLHGSINWYRCGYCEKNGNKLLIISTKENSCGIDYFQGKAPYICSENKCGNLLYQYFLPPRGDKEYYLPYMAEMWSFALKRMLLAETITIVGCSFADDDQMLRYLFIYMKSFLKGKDIRGKKYVVVNPENQIISKTIQQLLDNNINNIVSYKCLKDFLEGRKDNGHPAKQKRFDIAKVAPSTGETLVNVKLCQQNFINDHTQLIYPKKISPEKGLHNE